MDELKDCPFCGCGIDNATPHPFPSKFDLDGKKRERVREWTARCGNPDCAVEVVAPTAELATERWNRRAPEPAVMEEHQSGDDNIAAIESYADALGRMALCNPRTADGYNLSKSARLIRDYVALLRRLSPCTCPSGDGSLRWPCPVPPATAAHTISKDCWCSPVEFEPGHWVHRDKREGN